MTISCQHRLGSDPPIQPTSCIQPELQKQKAYILSDIDFEITENDENLPPSDPPSESEDEDPNFNGQTSDDIPLMALL